MKGKALVISVGTGTRADAQASLAHGLCYSITNNNPDYILFIVTTESREKTLPLIKANLGDYDKRVEEHLITNSDDLMELYGEFCNLIRDLKKQFQTVTVDFTSGTKAMSSALSMAGCMLEVNQLCYITGPKKDGITINGQERALTVAPLEITVDRKYAEAVTLFNRYQYAAVLLIVEEVERMTSSEKVLDKFLELKSCARAYSAWDKFDHQAAMQCLEDVSSSDFNENKRFLNELDKNPDKEPRYIADLINNAKRRAEEGKYDDAVARLYRTIELLSQYSLRRYGINDTSKVPVNQIPERLIEKYQLGQKGEVKVALDLGWNILAEKGDPAGIKFVNDNSIKDSLGKRNKSILAHGLTPLSQDDFSKFVKPVLQYSQMKIKEIDRFMSLSSFRQWPV